MGRKAGAEERWACHPDGPEGLHPLSVQDAGCQVRKQRRREVGGICVTQMPLPAGPGDSVVGAVWGPPEALSWFVAWALGPAPDSLSCLPS